MREIIPCSARKTSHFRLPDNVRPCHYEIEIEPDLAAKTFNGFVVIHIEVLKSTNVIVFHALRIKVKHITVTNESGACESPKIHYLPDHEAAYVRLAEKLPVRSRVVLEIEYVGQMGEQGSMGGLYPSPYMMPGGGMKLGFETMMEPTMARAVFPCLDEPEYKATFKVSLSVDSELTCLSNMEIISETAHVGRSKKKVAFQITPRMSTYLVVMVAGYFNFLESNDFRVPVRVWAALDKDINNTAYALEIAVKALKAHEANFSLDYPLQKLDMVAIPGHQGGMEHWGCVTYQENSIVLNDSSSAAEKMRLAAIVTHELAHQWFGNIVTMRWWDSVWLNESFADWATFHALTQMLPGWNTWASFLASDPSSSTMPGYQEALALDSSQGSHAIQDPDIPPNSAFDSIAYLKGCSVVRMIAEDLGVDVFLRGVGHYLKKHLYGNATTEDLWDALSEISGKDVKGIMGAWTQTVGYPMLTVIESQDVQGIIITQSRFLQNGDDDTRVKAYPVTIQFRVNGSIHKHLMKGRQLTLFTDLSDYQLNVDQVGFYRVSYPLSRLHKFASEWSSGVLGVKDKVGIISDLGAIVRTGSPSRRARLLDFFRFLGVVTVHETNLFVWREILGQLANIRAAFLFEGDEALEALRALKVDLLRPLLSKVPLNFEKSETAEEIFLKVLLISQLEDIEVVQNLARRAWNELLDGDKDALNPNIRKVIFDTVLLLDDTDATWNTLKSIAFEKTYIRSTDPVTHLEALYALGSSPNPELTDRALKLITPQAIPPTCANKATPFVLNWAARLNILKSLAQHPNGARASWHWLRKNWDVLRHQSGSINSYAFIGAALRGLSTERHLEEVESFFEGKVEESFKLEVAQAIDVIRARSRFVKADREDLLNWAKTVATS